MLVLVIQIVMMALCFWPLARGVRWREWRAGMGVHGGQNFFVEVGYGVLGYFAGLPIMAVGILIMLVFAMIAQAAGPNNHPIVFDYQTGAKSALLLFFAACVLAPLLEELLFRGAFYHALRGVAHPLIAGPLIGVIFAAVHPQGWIAIPVLGAIGFNFAMLREWRGSIIAPIVAHALNNSVVVSMLVLTTNL